MIGEQSFPCELQPRRVSCLFADSSKTQTVLTKSTRNKRNECDIFLVSLHFAQELEIIQTDFGSQFDIRLKDLIAVFVYVTQEPQGLLPNRGIFHHKIRVTSYPKRQRRSRLTVPEFRELMR